MKQASYPVASHSYFHVTNKAEQKQRFLNSETVNPTFAYRDMFDTLVVQGRLDEAVQENVEKSLKLVLAGIRIQKAEPSEAELQEFRTCNTDLFQAPTLDLVAAIFGRVSQLVSKDTAELWQYVTAHVPINIETRAVAPSQRDFMIYKNYLERYIDTSISREGSLVDELHHTLETTGLKSKGWSVKLVDDASHARVNHHEKTIRIGREYKPRTLKAKKRIALHEVYGHALRGPQQSLAESEGFAIVLEQLLDERFKFRRAYRYLAVALGWGVDGKQRDFRDVHEIIWRLMVIVSGYAPHDAKSYAFDECVRAFRGGRPDIAGAVYLKDAVYLVANITIWDRLCKDKLEYNDFIDIIEGRRKVLA